MKTGKNDVMFVRISYHYNRRFPIVEFQRVYSSTWYELDTRLKAHRIQELISRHAADRIIQHVRNNLLVISLAL